MAAYLLNRSMDQSISPYKSQMRNPNNAHHLFVSMPTYGFTHSNFNSTGILQLPSKFLSGSYPPPYSLQLPPLLLLPAASPRWSSTAGRGILCPPRGNRKTNSGNRTRGSSVSTKKPKSPTKTHKKEQKNSDKKSVESVDTVPSTSHLELHPKELRKDAVKGKALPIMAPGNSMYSNNCVNSDSIRSSFTAQKDRADMFSGSTALMTISPPPSSLPLPTFCLKPKLRCNAKVKSGIDTGATDDLQRLLRLR